MLKKAYNAKFNKSYKIINKCNNSKKKKKLHYAVISKAVLEWAIFPIKPISIRI